MVIGETVRTGETCVEHDEAGEGAAGAAERSGAVRVHAAPSGLPAHVHVDPQLPARCDREQLAARILRVCTAAAAASQARQRAELSAGGIDDGLLGRIGLPDAAGAAAIGQPAWGEEEPESWLTRA
ncbi:hypothetical protein [Tomitella fengzijianii]|uniref:Uncharacterized protein n=1 Tax=Tomitella fengzijianii TaxID=2597660 RepID=A0A516X5L9_9ACTN|nr:hypothetical protein [Tomitella fengzijianii]QDQ98346.1 hypothetical protein FO059_14770 [Tomitella fengzijianii]